MKHCRNCNYDLLAEADYCPSCGQSAKTILRPWREALRELSSELLDFDGRMLRSFRLLLTRPGFLSYEYIHGRRMSYTSPLRMYLVISLVFFLILPAILPERTITSPDLKVSADLYSQAMFLLLPVFALLLKAFYRTSFYLAHLVFAVHLFSAMYVAFAIMLPMEDPANRYPVVAVLQVGLFFAMVAYSIVALKTTYGESWKKSILKFLGLLAIFMPIIASAIELASHIDFSFF